MRDQGLMCCNVYRFAWGTSQVFLYSNKKPGEFLRVEPCKLGHRHNQPKVGALTLHQAAYMGDKYMVGGRFD
jgi:hypothetical protein